jgi:hypothetical protein
MFALLAAFALCLPQQADAQRVKSAIAELEQAWKSPSADERVRAIQASADVRDAEVLKLVARGLRDKEPAVQRAAIEALRFAGHPEALKELQAFARDEKASRKDPLLCAALLRAVGQYGSASSIRILGDDLWSLPEPRVLQARILGLGRIRTRESLERLLELLKLAGPQRIEAVMPDFRLALVALSGVDKGAAAQAWQDWWSANRAQWKPADEPAALPKDLERKWQVYWGEQESDYRPRKRSERGKDSAS